jgi:hypothetical protein
MKKTAEQEVQIKLAVRDLIVRNPLISGHQLCRDLARGIQDIERQSARLVLRGEATIVRVKNVIPTCVVAFTFESGAL